MMYILLMIKMTSLSKGLVKVGILLSVARISIGLHQMLRIWSCLVIPVN